MRTALAILALVGAAYAVLDNFDPHPLDTNPGGTKAHVHRSGGTTYIDAEVVALEAVAIALTAFGGLRPPFLRRCGAVEWAA